MRYQGGFAMVTEVSDPVRILVVDDDPGDVLMIEEALESSEVERQIDVVGSLEANAYVTKPISLDAFIDVVRSIDEFFGRVVVLPRRR